MPSSYHRGPQRRRPTQNQEALQQNVDLFEARCSFGKDLLEWLRKSDVTVTSARQTKNGRWDLYLVLPKQLGSMFGIDLELLCVVADFERVEPRVLADLQARLRGEARLDNEIALLATQDAGARNLARRRAGETAIVTLAVAEIGSNGLDLRGVLARDLPSVDHFNVTKPITDPGSFFGRLKDIDEATSTIEAGQHLGWFGLRKSGKSSLLIQVGRIMADRGWEVTRLDLNAYVGRASAMTRDLVAGIAGKEPRGGRRPPHRRGDWLTALEDAIDRKSNAKGFLVVLDEIDTLLPGRIESAGGEVVDRRNMLRALVQFRAFAQTLESRGRPPLVLLSAGVDATVFELPRLDGGDNPLYQFSVVRFLEPLDRRALHSMVRTLGKRCGMAFSDPQLVDELLEEYGGHPLLTRQACSYVHRHRSSDSVPYHVTVDALLAAFSVRGTGTPLSHAHDTLDELAQWYPDEGELVLELLRTGVADTTGMVHAIDYGLVAPDGEVRMRALMRKGA